MNHTAPSVHSSLLDSDANGGRNTRAGRISTTDFGRRNDPSMGVWNSGSYGWGRNETAVCIILPVIRGAQNA